MKATETTHCHGRRPFVGFLQRRFLIFLNQTAGAERKGDKEKQKSKITHLDQRKNLRPTLALVHTQFYLHIMVKCIMLHSAWTNHSSPCLILR